MPKDNRKIHSGVRHGGTTYTEGMEDELAEVMSADQLQRLTDKGSISGNWGLPAEAETKAETAKTAGGKKTKAETGK